MPEALGARAPRRRLRHLDWEDSLGSVRTDLILLIPESSPDGNPELRFCVFLVARRSLLGCDEPSPRDGLVAAEVLGRVGRVSLPRFPEVVSPSR